MELGTIIKGVVANNEKKGLIVPEQVKLSLGGMKLHGVRAQGNFTTAMVRNGDLMFVGIAKRNPKDKPNHIRGQYLAVSRAVRAALETML